MLIARPYESADAEGLDRLLGCPQSGDVRLDRDRITVVGVPGRPVGCLVWRAGGIVHELRTGYGLAQRHMADLLVKSGIEDAVSQPHQLWEALFLTDSDNMARYALELGAVEEVGKRIFTLNLRGDK